MNNADSYTISPYTKEDFEDISKAIASFDSASKSLGWGEMFGRRGKLIARPIVYPRRTLSEIISFSSKMPKNIQITDFYEVVDRIVRLFNEFCKSEWLIGYSPALEAIITSLTLSQPNDNKLYKDIQKIRDKALFIEVEYKIKDQIAQEKLLVVNADLLKSRKDLEATQNEVLAKKAKLNELNKEVEAKEKLKKEINKQIENDCDFVLLFPGGDGIACHKNILVKIPYFNTAIQWDSFSTIIDAENVQRFAKFKERYPIVKGFLEFRDTNFDSITLRLLIKYAYQLEESLQGKRKLNQKIVEEMQRDFNNNFKLLENAYLLAEYLQYDKFIDALQIEYYNDFKQNISDDQCLRILSKWCDLKEGPFLKYILNQVIDNFDTFSRKALFSSIDHKFLLKIVKADELCIENEDCVLNAITSWVENYEREPNKPGNSAPLSLSEVECCQSKELLASSIWKENIEGLRLLDCVRWENLSSTLKIKFNSLLANLQDPLLEQWDTLPGRHVRPFALKTRFSYNIIPMARLPHRSKNVICMNIDWRIFNAQRVLNTLKNDQRYELQSFEELGGKWHIYLARQEGKFFIVLEVPEAAVGVTELKRTSMRIGSYQIGSEKTWTIRESVNSNMCSYYYGEEIFPKNLIHQLQKSQKPYLVVNVSLEMCIGQ
jgi:hypothetical protein